MPNLESRSPKSSGQEKKEVPSPEEVVLFADDPRVFEQAVEEQIKLSARVTDHEQLGFHVENNVFMRRLKVFRDGFFIGLKIPRNAREKAELLKAGILGSDKFNSVLALARSSREFLAHFPAKTVDQFLAEPESKNKLKRLVENILFEDEFRKNYSDDDSGKTVEILSPKIINPIVTWYVQEAYLDLEKTLQDLFDHDLSQTGNPYTAISNLIRLGMLYGKFETTNPNAAYYRKVLSPFIFSDHPDYLQRLDIVHAKEAELPADIPQLLKLKNFWEQMFAIALVSRSRTNGGDMGAKALSPAAYRKALSQLSIDNTITPFPEATSHGQKILARTEGRDSYETAMREQREAAEKLEKEAERKTAGLEDFLQELIVDYEGKKFFARETGKKQYSQECLKLNKVIPLVFQRFIDFSLRVPEGESLNTYLLASETQRILMQHSIQVESIFGPTFTSLPDIEQVSLMLFYGLTFNRSERQLRPGVIGCLQKKGNILSLLRLHHRFVVQAPTDREKTLSQQPSVASTEGLTEEMRAQRRLSRLTLADGLLSPSSPELAEKMAEEAEVFTQSLEISKKALEKDAPLNFLISFAPLMYLSMMLSTFDLGIFRSNFHLSTLIVALGASVALLYQYNDMSFANSVLPVMQVFTDNYTAELKRVAENKKLSRKKVKKMYSLIAGATLIAVLIVSALPENIIDNINIPLINRPIAAATGTFPDFPELQPTPSFTPSPSATLEQRPTIPPATSLPATPESQPAPSASDSLPDRIDPESLKNRQPRYQGQLLDVPDYVDLSYGEEVGYFPADWVDQAGNSARDVGREPLEAYTVVDDLSTVQYQATKDELVYTVPRVGESVFPPNGYVISKVFQEGGGQPQLATTGQIYYAEGDKPSRIIVVAEFSRMFLRRTSDGRVTEFPLIQAPTYEAWQNFDYESVLRLNQQLGGDPNLQKLHRGFIDELNIQAELVKSGQVTDMEAFRKKYSQIIEIYAKEFGMLYIDPYRHYSLGFQPQDKSGQYPILRAIANQPEDGFFCSDAALAFRDFFSSAGVRVFTQPGNTLRNYNGDLYSDLGHMNDVMELPDGRVLFIDMTPPVTDKTPQADIDALQLKNPEIKQLETDTPTNREKAEKTLTFKESKNNTTTIGLALLAIILAGGGGYAAYRGIKKWRKRYLNQVEQKIEKTLQTTLPVEPDREKTLEVDLQSTPNKIGEAVLHGVLLVAEFYDQPEYAAQFGRNSAKDGNFRQENIQIIAHDIFELVVNGKRATGQLSDTLQAALLGKRAEIEAAISSRTKSLDLTEGEDQVDKFITPETSPIIKEGIKALITEINALSLQKRAELTGPQRGHLRKVQEVLAIFLN